MRIIRLFVALAFAAIAVMAQSAPSSPQPAATPPQQPPTSPDALKTQTRLVTVDVVATDSHGKAVRGLTRDDFQLSEEHAGP